MTLTLRKASRVGISEAGISERAPDVEARFAALEMRDAARERQIAALETEIAAERAARSALEVEVAGLLAAVPRDAADSELRKALAVSTEGDWFTAADLLKRAKKVDPALAAALLAADINTPLELGTWLRDQRGVRDQIEIARVRRPRRWCVRFCTSAR